MQYLSSSRKLTRQTASALVAGLHNHVCPVTEAETVRAKQSVEGRALQTVNACITRRLRWQHDLIVVASACLDETDSFVGPIIWG